MDTMEFSIGIASNDKEWAKGAIRQLAIDSKKAFPEVAIAQKSLPPDPNMAGGRILQDVITYLMAVDWTLVGKNVLEFATFIKTFRDLYKDSIKKKDAVIRITVKQDGKEKILEINDTTDLENQIEGLVAEFKM